MEGRPYNTNRGESVLGVLKSLPTIRMNLVEAIHCTHLLCKDCRFATFQMKSDRINTFLIYAGMS